MDNPTSEIPRGRFQYSLKGLLLLTTWFAVLCAMANMNLGWGAIFLILSLIVVAIVSRVWRSYAVWAVAFLLILGFLLPAINPEHVSSRTGQCMNNLKLITLALKTHEAAMNKFPPAYIADKNGKPMHSWRVLILPYIECKYLYDQYHFDEPWDGPNNRKLADKCPEIFRCPSDEAAGSPRGNTSYVAIIGPHAAWTGEKGTTSADFQDGESNTILVVETTNSGINWMEPRDLVVGQMARTINAKSGQGISSKHTGGANAAFADGSGRYLDENLSPETLEALITRDGGEDVDLSKP